MNESSFPSLVVHKGYPIWFKDRTITSWRNLLQRIQIQDAPPSTINRSGSEVFVHTTSLSNFERADTLQKSSCAQKQLEYNLISFEKSKTQASASDSYSC